MSVQSRGAAASQQQRTPGSATRPANLPPPAQHQIDANKTEITRLQAQVLELTVDLNTANSTATTLREELDQFRQQVDH